MRPIARATSATLRLVIFCGTRCEIREIPPVFPPSVDAGPELRVLLRRSDESMTSTANGSVTARAWERNAYADGIAMAWEQACVAAATDIGSPAGIAPGYRVRL